MHAVLTPASAHTARNNAAHRRRALSAFALYLRIVEFQRRLAAKNLDHHFQLFLLAVDFFDHSGETVEGTVDNLHILSDDIIVEFAVFRIAQLIGHTEHCLLYTSDAADD